MVFNAGLWMKYKVTSFNKLSSCYNKCLKLFFQYKLSDSATQIPSFSTLLHITAKLLFIHPGVIVPTPNSIVKYLGSTVCFQLRYMYVCILLRFWVLCSLLAVITFLRVFTFPDNCMCCLSLYCFVLVVLTA